MTMNTETLDILVIEDDPDDTLLMQKYLAGMQRFDARVTIEPDLDRALRLCKQHRYDAVFLDYYWASRTAVDLLRNLPARLRTTPFIIITSTDDLAVTEAVVEAGAWDFIYKADLGPKMLERAILHVVQRQRHEQAMYQMARQDSLTGVANRLMFEEHLKRALSRAKRHHRRVAILAVDLDDFKQVNDSLGHDTGDLLLKLVAERLQRELRGEDLVARLGGDEFAILVQEFDEPGDLEIVARKLLAALREPAPIRGISSQMTGSIGIAIYPDHARSALDMMRYADIALYAAKDLGRNDVVMFNDELERGLTESLELEQEIRRAISEDEFEPWFQPVFDCQTGQLKGAEMLTRWRHPRRGLLMPAVFLPVAEGSSLMLDLDGLMIRKTLEQLAAANALPTEAQPWRLSFNITGAQLLNQDFASNVLALCTRLGVDPGFIEFEVIERSLTERNAQETLKGLRDQGFGLVIDDFGTGFSSLASLGRLPATTLKINRSFVQDLPADHSSRAIFEAILCLGDRLGMATVAVGVETDAEWQAVRELGTGSGQGFLLARPMPLTEWAETLHESASPGEPSR